MTVVDDGVGDPADLVARKHRAGTEILFIAEVGERIIEPSELVEDGSMDSRIPRLEMRHVSSKTGNPSGVIRGRHALTSGSLSSVSS